MKYLKLLIWLAALAAIVVLVRLLPPPPSPNVTEAGEAASNVVVDAQVELANPTEGTDDVPDVFAPVTIDPAQPTASAAVGQTLAFDVPQDEQATIVVSSDHPEIADVYSGNSDAGFDSPAGGDAYAAGTAVITIELPNGKTSKVTLTVTP